jgi:hypothetical protein
VLHPYFKLAYSKLAWEGAEEQEEECQMENQHMKNWQDEAQKILENTVCPPTCEFTMALIPSC